MEALQKQIISLRLFVAGQSWVALRIEFIKSLSLTGEQNRVPACPL